MKISLFIVNTLMFFGIKRITNFVIQPPHNYSSAFDHQLPLNLPSIETPIPQITSTSSKQDVMSYIKHFFTAGVKFYELGELELAEKSFALAIKPVLSKVNSHSNVKIEDYKELLLDALYHIGMIYLKSPKYYENFAKAAGIFQYCHKFSEKYEVKLFGASGEEINFVQKAYLSEMAFVDSISILSKASHTINDDVDKEEFDLYQNQLNLRKAKLDKVRADVKSKLYDIGEIKVEKVSYRAALIEDLYKSCNKFFINNNQGQIYNLRNKKELGFIEDLILDSFHQLGPIPEGCNYSIVGLGSIAGGKMTPWSDLDFAILINEDKEEYKEYFRNLTKLLHIKITNLGETPLRSLGVESLNNFRTAEKGDDWFWDDLTNNGFSFDGPDWHACKSPLGRVGGYKALDKVKITERVEGYMITHKPDFELILTPKQMAEFQRDEVDHNGSRYSWVNSDKHLVQALKTSILIYGSQELLDQYRQEQLLAIDYKAAQNRIIKSFLRNLDSFSLKLGHEEEGKLIDVKKEIFRIGDRLVDDLSEYFSVYPERGQVGLTAWEMIDKIKKRGALNEIGAQHLKEAFSIASELRLAAYSYSQGQSESISTYTPATGHLNEQQRQKLLERTFYVKGTELLHHFYYVILPLQTILESFDTQDQDRKGELSLQSDMLFDISDYTKGMTHARFLEYDQALTYMKKAGDEITQDEGFLNDLFFLYYKVGDFDEAIYAMQKLCNLQIIKYHNGLHADLAKCYNNLASAYHAKADHKSAQINCKKSIEIYESLNKGGLHQEDIADTYNNLGNIFLTMGNYKEALAHFLTSSELYKLDHSNQIKGNIARNYNNLGLVYQELGDYDSAIEFFNKALQIDLKLHENNPNHKDISRNYVNLANSYVRKGDISTSIYYNDLAVSIYLSLYKTVPNHPDTAKNYFNFASTLRAHGNFDESLLYFNKALEIYEKAYGKDFTHPDIADTHNNLGNLYLDKEDYNTATTCFEKALAIYRVVFEFKPHANMARSHNNLGIAYQSSGLLEESISCFNNALEIYDKVFDSNTNHPSIGKIHINLASTYFFKKEYMLAIQSYEKALEIYKLAYPNNNYHQDIGDSYNNLGLPYQQLGKLEDAIEYYTKALKIYYVVYEQNLSHVSIDNAYENLESAYKDYITKERGGDLNMNKKIKITFIALGNIAFTLGDFSKALTYYNEIYPDIKESDFNTQIFTDIQLEHLSAGYEASFLPSLINCQLVLIKIDPELSRGNHYHNLACFYAVKGDIELADETFIEALKHEPVKASLHTEYAQFLVLNIEKLNSVNVTIDPREISNHLYLSIQSPDNESQLNYGKLERNSISPIIKDIIEAKNASVTVSSKILAYYLLAKYPEYIREGDNIKTILESFINFSANHQDEINSHLLLDALGNASQMSDFVTEPSHPENTHEISSDPNDDNIRNQQEEGVDSVEISAEEIGLVGVGLASSDEG